MRLRCARASLRSSGVTSDRERLRDGSAARSGGSEYCDWGDGASTGGEGREMDEGPAWEPNAESASRFMLTRSVVKDEQSIRRDTCKREGKTENGWSCRKEMNRRKLRGRAQDVRGGREESGKTRLCHVSLPYSALRK